MSKFFDIQRRRAISLIAGAVGASTLALPQLASAEDKYPNRAVNLVVGFAAGGQSDILARKIAKEMGRELGQSIVVQNKEGATSTIAIRFVAAAKPDGYNVLLAGSSGMVMAPLVMKLPFDPVKDFNSVGMVTKAAISISVHPSVPAKNLKELIELVRRNPGKYSYAHSGFGGVDHMTGEFFKQAAGGLDILAVPYKGAAPAATGVIGGEVPILITTFSSAYPFHKNGQLRMLAMTGARRSDSAPDMPTAAEQGVEALVAETYNWLTLPAGTPPEVIAALRAANTRILANPAFIAELKAAQFEPVPVSTPQSTDSTIAAEVTKWRKVAAQANIKPE